MAGESPRRPAESARRGPGAGASRPRHTPPESGEANGALAQCEASCAPFRRAGELAWVARSLSQGGIARDVGDLARAEQLFSESFELRRELGDDRASLAIVLGNLAIVALDRHDLARAREYANECLASAEGANQWIHAATPQILAHVAVEKGEVTEAGDLLRSAFPVLRQLGTYRLLEFLDSCAGLAGTLGLAEAAAGLVGAVDAALDEIGARMVPSDERLRKRRLAPARSPLGADRLEALRRDGSGLTFEEARRRSQRGRREVGYLTTSCYPGAQRSAASAASAVGAKLVARHLEVVAQQATVET